jgi:hypothetical protein
MWIISIRKWSTNNKNRGINQKRENIYSYIAKKSKIIIAKDKCKVNSKTN